MYKLEQILTDSATCIPLQVCYIIDDDLWKVWDKQDFADILTRKLRPIYPSLQQYRQRTWNIWSAHGYITISIGYSPIFKEYDIIIDASKFIATHELFPCILRRILDSYKEYKQNKQAEFDTLYRLGIQISGTDFAKYLTSFVGNKPFRGVFPPLSIRR
jgi:hypothetical protein